MRPTNFTLDEKELIIRVLNLRIKTYQAEGYLKYEKEINEILGKLDSSWDSYYSNKFKNHITSCINEFLNPLEEKINEYFIMPSIKFTRLTDQEKEEIGLIDLCFSILEKTGFKKSKLKFSDVFEKIEKLKKVEWIGLSRTDEKNVYKVAFINKSEKMEWSINSKVDLIHESFTQQTVRQVEDFPSYFTDFLTKREAREIINNCNPVIKNVETLELVKYLMN